MLYTGADFIIIDFEGEPVRPNTERRLKQSALRDVATMIRSFPYTARESLLRRAEKGPPNALDRVGEPRQSMDLDDLRHWADLWYFYVSGTLVQSYRQTVANHPVAPTDPTDWAALLEIFILEKSVYELDYELNHRPGWLPIPVRGIEQILRV